jgi:hypothetical protein
MMCARQKPAGMLLDVVTGILLQKSSGLVVWIEGIVEEGYGAEIGAVVADFR